MDDSEILYTLLVKNVSTSWPGSNIIEKNDNAKSCTHSEIGLST